MIEIRSWPIFKSFVDSRALSIQFIEMPEFYYMFAIDGSFGIEFKMDRNPSDTTELDVFESSYKDKGNKPLSQQNQAFASKTLPNGKALFKRFTGINQALEAGSNIFTWTQSSFPQVKFLALEVIGAELGDTCSLYVLDTTTGTYSTIPNYPLNQFAFNANVAPGFYRHASEYDADIFQNLQIKFVYNSVSAKTLYLNLDMNEVK